LIDSRAPAALVETQVEKNLTTVSNQVGPGKCNTTRDRRRAACHRRSDPLGTGNGSEHGTTWDPGALVVSVKSEFPLRESPLEAGHKLPLNTQLRTFTGRKEGCRNWIRRVWSARQTIRRNHAVDMGMMLRPLSPGVEHDDEPNQSAEVAGD